MQSETQTTTCNTNRIIIGSRKSTLAKIQAWQVQARINHFYPNIEVVFNFRDSMGDINQTASLTGFDSRGVFTDDFYTMLINKEIDIAVHSWKDLPIAERDMTTIAATIERADCRDILLIRRDRINQIENDQKISVLSSSPRREYNIGEFIKWGLPKGPEPLFVPVRGNIETRIKKLIEGEVDSLVVAKAALDRLLCNDFSPTHSEAANSNKLLRPLVDSCFPILIPLSVCPAAPAQGALAIEICRDRTDLHKLFSVINDQETFECVQREREILAAHGGGCHQKIGATVLKRHYGTVEFIRGLTDDGVKLDSITLIKKNTLPKATSADKIWPPINDELNLFERTPIKLEQKVEHPDPHCGLMISKKEALPDHWKVSPETPVWVAGLTTWRALAKKGIWINGCSESLGDHEAPCFEMLLPQTTKWIKLSHDQSPHLNECEQKASYELKQTAPFPKLSNVTHWFWRSGSLFKAALATNPHLKECWHGCGPGNTYTIISEALGNQDQICIYLEHSDFLKEVTP